MKNLFFVGCASAIAFLLVIACNQQPPPPEAKETGRRALYVATRTTNPPVLDGIPNDPVWSAARWHSMDQLWLGDSTAASEEDFYGRFQIAWDENTLYILAETSDDELVRIPSDNLQRYGDEDCLVIFVDEDHSGGSHQYNYNAFAYYIGLDSNVVDMRPDSVEQLYNSHARSARSCVGDVCIWEIALTLYPDTYEDNSPDVRPVKLGTGKKIGFALAYSDNDRNPTGKYIIGSVPIAGGSNRAWQDASLFGTLELQD